MNPIPRDELLHLAQRLRLAGWSDTPTVRYITKPDAADELERIVAALPECKDCS